MRMLMAKFAIVFLFLPQSVLAADWYLAETDHFRVFSEGTEDEVRDYAVELERLDEAMRIMLGVGPDQEPPSSTAKVTVFRFGETRDIGNLAGARGVAGFFIPRAGNSVAFVPHREDRVRGLGQRAQRHGRLEPRSVLFHEYAHYFMFQHGAAAYPGWYVEGFAELFATLEFGEDRFQIGEVPEYRSIALGFVSPNLERMLAPPADITGEDVQRMYAWGWLLTSHLSFAPERQGQLRVYLRLINEGQSSIDAAREAFGDLRELENEMEAYRRSRARLRLVPYLYDEGPALAIRPLSEAEEARMELMILSRRGVTREQAQDQLDEARALVARYPESIEVVLAATEVEFDAGNYDEAEQLAERALGMDANSVGAALYWAHAALAKAEEDPAQFQVARNRYIRANNLETGNPEPLYGYYLSYLLADETPPDDAVAALESAFGFAPFDPGIRTTLAYQLLAEDEYRIALNILQPLLNNPDATRESARLRGLFDLYEEGEEQCLLDFLKPDLPGEEDEDEDEDEDENDPCYVDVDADDD